MSIVEPGVLVGRTITAAAWEDTDRDSLLITCSDGCVISLRSYGQWGGDASVDIEIVTTRRREIGDA